MAFQLQWRERGLYRKFSGTISGEDIATSNLDLHGDPRYETLRYIINDFRAIEAVDICDDHIALIANTSKIANLSNRDMKIALVTDRPEFQPWIDKYALAIRSTTFEVRQFDELRAAQQWVEAGQTNGLPITPGSEP